MATAYQQPDSKRFATRLGKSVLELVGDTPLLRLERVTQSLAGVELLAKAEWVNPGGSVKDRAAMAIVKAAIASGELSAGKRLLDSTSGNTGIAYAMIGAAMGFGVTLCMPSNVSAERKRILEAYGVEIIYTEAAEGSDGAMVKARELAAGSNKFYYADQYSNDNNWLAHYHGTANEIWKQTDGGVTHFVAMLGTTGTFVGTARRLKELDPEVQCISLQPDSPLHGIEGGKHMKSAIVPAIYDPTIANDNLEISTEAAYEMCKRLAREEGLLVGVSAAASVVGSLRVAKQCAERGEEAVIVTVLCDNADKYLSERFWGEE